MTTRQEIRQQQQANTISPDKKPRQPRHPMRTFWGVVALLLLGISLLLNQTILNQHFAEHEVQRSNLASTVNNNLNQVAGKYGINDGALDESTTNKLLTQAVDQIYAGKPLQLDFSSAIKKSMNSAAPSIDGVQIPKGLLSSSVGSAASDGISASLNQQINTPEVQQFTNILQVWKNINRIVMLASAILLVVVLAVLLVGRASLGSFLRLIGISTVLLGLITELFKGLIISIGQRFPDYWALIVQVANDMAKVGINYCLALGVLFIILIIIGITTHGIRQRI